MLSPSPTPTRQRRKEARPQELLDAALELFVEKGFAATRDRGGGRAAGVSKGTLYLYYPSKEELFKAVVRDQPAAPDRRRRRSSPGSSKATHRRTAAPLLAHLVAARRRQPGRRHPQDHHGRGAQLPGDSAQFYTDEVIDPGAPQLFGGALRRGIDRGEFRAVPTSTRLSHALMRR